MAIDWIEVSRSLPYVGTALLFALFAYGLFELQDKKDTKREAREDTREQIRMAERQTDQKRQDAKDSERDQRFISAFANLAHDWQQGMLEDRTRQAESLALVTRELERIGNVAMLTNALIKEHDTWEKAVYEAGRRRGDTGPLTGKAG